MTGKQLKFYETLFEFAGTDYLNDSSAYFAFMEFAADYDFAEGARLWEFLFLKNEKELTLAPLCNMLSVDTLEIFLQKSELKTLRMLADSTVFLRAVYQYNYEGFSARTLKILLDMILGGKLQPADEALRSLSRNTVCEKGFGALMKELIDRLFVEILKKMVGGKAALSKKQTEFLLTHISRIKTNEKALLVQRLKEIS